MIIHNILNMKRNFFFAVGLALSLFACDNSHDDMYDPTWMREQYNNQWEMQFGEIDPNHTWNMAKQVKANLSIQEDALSEYTFKIYSANPLYDDDALLMAKTVVTTDAKGFAETSINFDALVGQKRFYVARVDDHGRPLVKSLSVSEGDVNVSFGTPLVGSRSRAAEMGDLPIMDCPYTEAEVNQLIADGYKISKGFNISNFCDIEKLTYGTGCPLHLLVLDTDFESQFFLELWGYTDVGNNYSWVSNGLDVGDFKIVVPNGVTWSYWKNNPNQETKLRYVDIIVASGGVLELYSYINMGDYGRIIVMPGGSVVDMTTNTVMTFNNNASTSLIYNAGTMDGIRCLLQNSGTTYIASGGVLTGEEISLQNYNSVLTNWGKIDVSRVVGNGNQGTINNGCLLRSDEKLQVLYLNQGANTAIECDEVYVNNLTMRENSLLRTGKLEMDGSETSIDYVGTQGSAALVSTSWIGINEGGGVGKINGAIYLEVNEYENADCDSVLHDVAPMGIANIGMAPIYIEPSSGNDDCTGAGNIPTQTVPKPEDKPQSWTVACEDLGSIGDFDFNDVVFKVSHVSGSREITVTPLAAGGTMTVNLYHDSELLGEIHKLLGEDDVTKMLNTGVEGEKGYNPGYGSSITLSVDESFTMTNNMGGFRLEILNGDGRFAAEIQGPVNGDSPQMICVPGDWRWPREWQKISDAYPDFVNWNSTNNAEWYKNSNSEYIY